MTLDGPLPSREMTLKAAKTKVSLIHPICNEFLSQFTKQKCQNMLTVTGHVDMPVHTKLGVQLQIRHMATSNEKVDVIIP